MTFKVNEHELDDQRIKDVLTCALEGGSNYWYEIVEKTYPVDTEASDVRYPHIDLPFMEGGSVTIQDQYGDFPPVRLNRYTLHHGLKILAEKCPKALNEIVNEDDDADTGDLFLQCCLFGTAVYG